MKKGTYKIQEGFGGGGVKGGGGGGGGGGSSSSAGGGGGGGGGGGVMVGGPYPGSSDTSFSACLLAMLFFLALCIVIILAAWPWGGNKSETTTHPTDGDRPEHEEYHGNRSGTPLPREHTTHLPHTTHVPQTTHSPHTTDGSPVDHTTFYPGATTDTSDTTDLTWDSGEDYDEDAVTKRPSKGGRKKPEKGGKGHPSKGSRHHHNATEDTEEYVGSESIAKDTDKRGERLLMSSEEVTTKTSGVKTVTTEASITLPVVGRVSRSTAEHQSSPATNASTVESHPDNETMSAERTVETKTESTGNFTPISTPRNSSSTLSSAITVPEYDYAGITDSAMGAPPETDHVKTTGSPHAVTESFLHFPSEKPGFGTTSTEDISTETSTEPSLTTTPDHEEASFRSLEIVKGSKVKKEVAMCETTACKSLSSRMLALMDHSSDPCVDFYSYACGGMRTENKKWLKEILPSAEAFSRIEGMVNKISDISPISHRKFQSFYHSCIYHGIHASRENSTREVQTILNSVGQFYTVQDWTNKPGNLTTLIGSLLKYHFSPLWDILLDVDLNNNSRFAVKLTTPIYRSPLGDLNGNKEGVLIGWPSDSCIAKATEVPNDDKTVDFNEIYQAYKDCEKNYIDYVKETQDAIKATETTTASKAEFIINETTFYLEDFLEKIKPIISPSVGEKKRILAAKEYKNYSIAELQKKYPLVEWKTLISSLLDYDTPESLVVQVYFESYFDSLFQELKNCGINERRLFNLLMAMFNHELYYGLVDPRDSCNREQYCLRVANELMGDISSALFLHSFHSEELEAFHSEIKNTFNELIIRFKYELGKIPWIDPRSQTKALEKVRKIKLFADGGVSMYLNDTYMDLQVEEIAVNSNYVENVISLLQRYRKKLYSLHKKNPTEPESIWSYFLKPFDTHGTAIYGLNAIVIPYGMMSKPFFNEDYPPCIQTATIGQMVASEIWHHFDKTGVQFDENGLKKNLLTEETLSKMANVWTCTENQFSTQHNGTADDGKPFIYKIHSSLSLNERLSANEASYLTYKFLWSHSSASPTESQAPLPWLSMTPQQLFFLSMAQSHCTKSSVYDSIIDMFENENLPPFLRVNDISYNSREFDEAFSCHSSHKTRCNLLNIG